MTLTYKGHEIIKASDNFYAVVKNGKRIACFNTIKKAREFISNVVYIA